MCLTTDMSRTNPKQNEYCVYMHTAPNGKRYIGITCCKPRNRRWQNGFGYVDNQHFYRAIKRYGWNNFQHDILEDNLTAEDAGRLESEYIKKYKTQDKRYGYNIMEGGQVGYHLSEEHKAKIGKANSGENNGMYGHHYTDEERKQMSERSAWRGRKHTEESRNKMSIAMKGNTNTKTGKMHHRARAVNQYSLDGEYIATYDTAKQASLATGALRSGICNCCKANRKQRTAGGFIWRYA